MIVMWLFPLTLLAVNAGLLLPPLPIRRRWKWLIAGAMLPFAFKFQVLSLFGGPRFFAPDLPSWLLWGAAWCFSVFLLLALLLILTLPLRLILEWFRRRPGRSRRPILALNLAAVLAALVLATLGLCNGARVPEVRRMAIPLPGVSGPFTVAVLADLHASRMTSAATTAATVERVMASRPDLVVLLGDFVDGTPETCGEKLAPLAELRAPWGVWAVTGNHEYYSDAEAWLPFLSGLGIRFLCNESVPLPNGAVLAGVNDPAAIRFGLPGPDFDRAFAGVPASAPKILLAHRPSLARQAVKHGVAIQFSGHTHGGMMPLLDRLVAAANGGMASGLYRRGETAVIVSNGSGIWGGYPLRLGRPAEILLVTLQPPPAAP